MCEDNIDGKFSPKDLEIILIGRSEETQKQLERELEKHTEPQFKMQVKQDSDEDETYTVTRDCPVKSNLCEWQPDGMEGVNCGFYNGYKKKCVFPRTVTHNVDSEFFLNLYDTFMGNIDRYWNAPEGSKADQQIEAKLQDMEIIPKKDVKEWDASASTGWAYAEFDDDGKEVRLVEIGTDKDISELLKTQIMEEQDRVNYARGQMQSELDGLRQKYSEDVRKVIDRVIELTKQLTERGPFPSE
ncbi:MAG TPA: hypothetical protein VJJ75_02515 [Candidatus Nanoarchaeia archaeon]|nr:hypothetical protein [Candidatus Nanoarchaeia archaeon]